MIKKYILTIESEHPPQVWLNDHIPKVGTVIELKIEGMPNRVTAAWLAERFNLSRKTIIEKVGTLNKGDQNKHLYDPKEVIPLLENLHLISAKRGARRKN
ncbi:TPA: hypothetical protein RG027_003057 [Acinetobacter baumannii]|nr:hypothetical protein [Acinetobacter baumannii]